MTQSSLLLPKTSAFKRLQILAGRVGSRFGLRSGQEETPLFLVVQFYFSAPSILLDWSSDISFSLLL